MRHYLVLLFICVLALTARGAQAATALRFDGQVSDYAKILEDKYEATLEKELVASDSANFAVATVATLSGQPIDVLAANTFRNWKLDANDSKPGILLLIAPYDKTLYAQVSPKFADRLTKDESDRIIENKVKPFFQQDAYEQGLDAWIGELMAELKAAPATTVEEAPMMTVAEVTRIAVGYGALSLSLVGLILGAAWLGRQQWWLPSGLGLGLISGFLAGGLPTLILLGSLGLGLDLVWFKKYKAILKYAKKI